jgi:hypothetical protein
MSPADDDAGGQVNGSDVGAQGGAPPMSAAFLAKKLQALEESFDAGLLEDDEYEACTQALLARAQSPPPTHASPTPLSLVEKLQALRDARQAGLLTPEEHDDFKRRVMDQSFVPAAGRAAALRTQAAAVDVAGRTGAATQSPIATRPSLYGWGVAGWVVAVLAAAAAVTFVVERNHAAFEVAQQWIGDDDLTPAERLFNRGQTTAELHRGRRVLSAEASKAKLLAAVADRRTSSAVRRGLEAALAAAEREDALFAAHANDVPTNRTRTRVHVDGVASLQECNKLISLFERRVVPGLKGNAYGNEQYTTAEVLDFEYRKPHDGAAKGSGGGGGHVGMTRHERALVHRLRSRLQATLEQTLGLGPGVVVASAGHVTMRNPLPWLGCDDPLSERACQHTLHGGKEQRVGGMSVHQDGCVFPHENVYPPSDPLSKVNFSTRVLTGPGDFYAPDDCRRKVGYFGRAARDFSLA